VIVVEDPKPGDEQPMLAFDTITLAPIDQRLIDRSMLSEADTAWLDAYHARVRDALQGQLDGDARAWLIAATAPTLETRKAA